MNNSLGFFALFQVGDSYSNRSLEWGWGRHWGRMSTGWKTTHHHMVACLTEENIKVLSIKRGFRGTSILRMVLSFFGPVSKLQRQFITERTPHPWEVYSRIMLNSPSDLAGIKIKLITVSFILANYQLTKSDTTAYLIIRLNVLMYLICPTVTLA